ncbi:hypothetical protein [Pseudoalteromonas piscicida]|uniref:hypothetical protein n=1 Tax=Pseudoalteromonas piscicida TaxID=43662 RepID=UPI0030A4FC2C
MNPHITSNTHKLAVLIRGIALLIGVFINQAIACQDKINELAFTRFHYGSEQDFPYQQLGVDTVRNKLFGREVLMAKADFKESEAIQFGEDVYIDKISIYWLSMRQAG